MISYKHFHEMKNGDVFIASSYFDENGHGVGVGKLLTFLTFSSINEQIFVTTVEWGTQAFFNAKHRVINDK